jgi:hypothetical protein
MSEESRRLVPGDSRQLIHRILDQPNLVAAVQSLPAQALAKLIHRVGLEDAGEIVALATTPQLVGIFDDDLWQSARPGKDETFDADRFSLWLEVMLEAGEEFAARKLADLPEDLVTLAFHKQVLVINIEELAVQMSSRAAERVSDDDLRLDKALESCLAEELGEYRIIARHHESWDTLFGLLVALDRDHHELLERLLDRLCALDDELIEDNGGLYQVLTAEESLESDVAGDREDRRSEQGFIAPSSASAFLALARTSNLDALLASDDRDPVTRAYFRNLRQDPGTPGKPGKPRPTSNPAPPATSGDAADGADLVELLREAEVLPPPRSTHLLAGRSDADGPVPSDRFTEALRRLAEKSPEIHPHRVRELAYLTNVLAAGCSLKRRAMRPVEAARAVMAACGRGLDRLMTDTRHSEEEVIKRTTADKLFRIGWHLLFHQVVLPAANTALSLFGQARGSSGDSSAKRALDRAAAALRSATSEGKPWVALRSLDLLDEHLDPQSLVALSALLDECPTLAGKLASGRRGAIEMIATSDQLRTTRAFLEALAIPAAPARP